MDELRYDQWLAELERLSATAVTAGMTTAEIAAATGRSAAIVRRQIGRGKALGLVRCVQVPRERIDGRMTLVSAYCFVKPPKSKRRRS